MASVGLLESVDRYDPQFGASFRTYASHRIQGAILSGIEASTERQRQLALKRRVRKERLELLGRQGEESGQEETFSRLADIAVGLAIGFMLDDLGMYQSGEGTYGDNAYAAEEMRQLESRLEKAWLASFRSASPRSSVSTTSSRFHPTRLRRRWG